MPRGIRKRFQLSYKVWFGNGGSISEDTTRDLTEAEFVKLLREVAARFERFAADREKREGASDGQTA